MEHFEILTAETLKDMENKLNEGSQYFGIQVEVVSPIVWDEREACYRMAVKVKVKEPYSRVYLASVDNGQEDLGFNMHYLPCDDNKQAKEFTERISEATGWENTEIEVITYQELVDRELDEYDPDHHYLNDKIYGD